MRFWGLLIFSLLFAGCNSEQQSLSLPGEAGALESAHGTDNGSGAPAISYLLKGKVLERIDAGRYSYLRLSTESGEIWAAVLQADVKVGDEVTIPDPMPMDGFESKTLNRTFDRIMFGNIAEEQETSKILMNAHSSVSEVENVGPISVDKASGPNGRTVAEVFAQKQDLNDRQVSVRGKVTKVNANILGRTWIHIQDGTGDPQNGTNDLAVTSQDNPSVGDTVLVEGVLHTDKNYGMGYVFPVIVEDATGKKE
jgi:hypothetical protein